MIDYPWVISFKLWFITHVVGAVWSRHRTEVLDEQGQFCESTLPLFSIKSGFMFILTILCNHYAYKEAWLTAAHLWWEEKLSNTIRESWTRHSLTSSRCRFKIYLTEQNFLLEVFFLVVHADILCLF